MAHLSDKRRTKCRDTILEAPQKYHQIPDEELEALDLLDRQSRREARNKGQTTPIAVKVALTADGKRIGHVAK